MIQAWLQGQSTSDLHGGGPTHLWSESQKSDGEHFERQNLGGTQVRFPSSSLQTLLYFSLQSVLVPHSFNSLQLFSTSRNWVFEQTFVSFVSLQTFTSPSTCWQVFAFSRCSQSLLHEQVTEEVGSLEIWEKALATCWCDRVTFSPRSFSAYMVARLVCKSWTPPFPCQLILGKWLSNIKEFFSPWHKTERLLISRWREKHKRLQHPAHQLLSPPLLTRDLPPERSGHNLFLPWNNCLA